MGFFDFFKKKTQERITAKGDKPVEEENTQPLKKLDDMFVKADSFVHRVKNDPNYQKLDESSSREVITSLRSSIYKSALTSFISTVETSYSNKSITEEEYKKIRPLLLRWKEKVGNIALIDQEHFLNFQNDLKLFSEQNPEWLKGKTAFQFFAEDLWKPFFEKYCTRAQTIEEQLGDFSQKITVTVSSSGSTAREKVSTGPITETNDGGFILNPKSPFPLTITGLARSEANTLKTFLDDEPNWDRKLFGIVFLFAKYNAHCREIDEYVAKYRPQYLGTIERLKAQSSEWNSASEMDKEDLLEEFKQQAIEELPEKPSSKQEFLSTLFEYEPVDVTGDDQLISLFGQDMETYQFYLYELSNIGKALIVPADNYYRKSFETLARKGLAIRGQDIGLAKILDGLRLKDINGVLLQGLIEKPFGRKAKAIEFALTIPDMMERLNKQIAFREIFQITKPEGIEIAEIQKCYNHANIVASLLRDTYSSGVRTLRELEDAKEAHFDYWEISAEECCKTCRQLHGKRYKRIPSRLPPFHIGCDCMIEGGYN